MSTDPTRLLAEGDLTTTERSVLEAAELAPPVPFDFARAEARLHASLPPTSTPQSPAKSPNSSSLHPLWTKPALKLFLSVTIGLGLIIATRLLPPSSPAPVPVPVPAPVPAPSSSPAPQPIVTPLPSSPPSPLPSTPPRKRPLARLPSSLAPKLAPAAPSAKTAAQTPDPHAELRAIAQAKSLSVRDPSAALRLLEQMRADFPRGYFLEERDALTILALVRAGQSVRAQREAHGFLERYPDGTHSDQVRRALLEK